jgi:transcriptional regulator with XRE-family HTH domain
VQAKIQTLPDAEYILGMQTGRPAKRKRSPFGERLHTLREQVGLSQQQVADKLGMSHRAYAHWERRSVALRPDQLQSLASALSLPVEALLANGESKRRGSGPAGKMRQLFEAASKLPRSKQEKILDILQPFVREHANGANGNS